VRRRWSSSPAVRSRDRSVQHSESTRCRKNEPRRPPGPLLLQDWRPRAFTSREVQSVSSSSVTGPRTAEAAYIPGSTTPRAASNATSRFNPASSPSACGRAPRIADQASRSAPHDTPTR
jgi:hypothetical protein